MTTNGWIQIFVFLALILAITKPLGVFMARVSTQGAHLSGSRAASAGALAVSRDRSR